MVLTDPIADMLTRIRNGLTAKLDTVKVPASKVKLEIARILLEEGYITSFEVEKKNAVEDYIVITLKYTNNKDKAIKGLKRVSRPGLRVYAKYDEIPQVLNGLGIAIVSTSKGIMTDKKARELKAGGEVIAFVW
ncbi:MAG: 30S ribosomal protein S8 [Clostridia bacterium]|nr:30S ribosomal protein S8 [Clostridia bacterium]